MKIQHITMGGTSVIRDTAEITDRTKRHFSALDLTYESKLYTVPLLPFKIKVTATSEGAAFDLEVKGNPVVVNLCSFDVSHSKGVYAHAMGMLHAFRAKGLNFKLAEPRIPQWMVSMIVNPFEVKMTDMMLAGEVELYIYERLYQAWKRG